MIEANRAHTNELNERGLRFMLKLNHSEYLDKVKACWVGKNIGGTIGGPFEGKRELLNVTGFTTPKGEPLPNDDLDLQLVWLLAMEDHGPYNLNEHILGEYWLSYITPNWNEYGFSKANMRMGIMPPMSGEYDNSKWKNSNGAWIRSEVWACLAPGCPDVAIRYAFADACVDHGMGEGTYGEVFTAALESAAFIEKDIRKLIDIGLSKLPQDCRIAKSVRFVIDSYDKHADWKTVRNKLVEMDSDIGWFQAPANIAYVILGLLYGEGDFKKSMLYAVNCGDDTDCTASTLGSILGIMHGMRVIPNDWVAHIGDRIITKTISGSCYGLAKTCSELTEKVTHMAPVVLIANQQDVVFTQNPTEIPEGYADSLYGGETCRKLFARTGYSYDIDFVHTSARVEFSGEPVIKPNESIEIKIKFVDKIYDQKHLRISLFLPDGWTASDYKRDIFMERMGFEGDECTWTVTVTAGDKVDAVNRVIVEAIPFGRPTPGYIPVTIMG